MIANRKVTKVVVTLDDGTERTLGAGSLTARTTYVEDETYRGLRNGKRPVGGVEISIPVEAEWVQGTEGAMLVLNGPGWAKPKTRKA